jgi:hypothetical protein
MASAAASTSISPTTYAQGSLSARYSSSSISGPSSSCPGACGCSTGERRPLHAGLVHAAGRDQQVPIGRVRADGKGCAVQLRRVVRLGGPLAAQERDVLRVRGSCS